MARGLAVSAFLAVALAGGSVAAKEPPRVLLLNAYSQSYSWAESEVHGFLSALRTAEPTALVYVEYMDWKNHPEARNLEHLLELLRYRYADQPLDLVAAMDNKALSFALEHRAALFPGVPIVFCGINDFDPAEIAGHPRVTGVAERANVEGTLALMLRLHPETEEIVVFTERSETGAALSREIESGLVAEQRVRHRFLRGLRLEQVLAEVEGLREGTLVLVDALADDGTGRPSAPRSALRAVSERSPVPVYGVLEFQLGHGIVGGWLLSGEQQGEWAAGVALRVLAGELPPPVLESPTRLAVDYRQLERFGIPLAAVPPEATVLNGPPPPFTARHWAAIGSAVAVAALFLAFNIILLANIRRRRRAEQTLRASEARFRALVEYGSDLITTFTADRRIDYRSPSYSRLLGYSMAEIHALQQEVMHPDDLAPFDAVVSEVLARPGNTFRGLARLRHRDDGWRWMEYVLHNHLDDAAVGRMVLNAWDVTERKRAEEERIRLLGLEQQARRQAEEANRSKDEFLAILSHELRTPLTPILGWARLLRTGDLPPADARQAFEAIERNAQSQTRLIEDLLDLSRIVTGKLRLELGRVELVEIVEAVLELVRPSAEAKQIRVECRCEALSVPLRADGARLQQVLWNLLANAIKFTPRGGRVEVRLSSSAEGVELAVEDTGEGISAEQLPYLFTRFWQADSTSTRRFGGLGLGLSIVRYVTEMHGGSVSAESPGPGKGATFFVRLPPALLGEEQERVSPEGSPEKASAVRNSLAGLTVLVVEDDSDTRDLLGLTLESHGATVAQARSAAEALEVLRRFRPQLLLSDLGLPDEDGCALLQRIRALPAGEGGAVRAIALTGYAHDEDRERSRAAGFELHLIKPIDPGSLVAAIAGLTGAPRAA